MKRYPLACLLMRLLVWLPVALSLSACKQQDPSPLERLPAATTTGANTWGCLVNGQAWTASGAENMRADWTVPDFCYCVMYFSSNSVTIGIDSIFKEINYDLKGDFSYAKLRKKTTVYNSKKLERGFLNIFRLDRQAGVMAGTFEFTIVGDAGDTLRVTDGRFDIGNMDR